MFLAFHFIKVGKLHEPSNLLLQPLWVNISQGQSEEHFITIIGHFNCLNLMLIHTFLCQFAEESQEPTKRITTPYMTKYERARVLGTRALQIRYLTL